VSTAESVHFIGSSCLAKPPGEYTSTSDLQWQPGR
ncbi:unnamed protein product, partial [Urochloa humidicola]